MTMIQTISDSLNKLSSEGSWHINYLWPKLDAHSERRHLYNSQQIKKCKDDHLAIPLKAQMLMKYKNHADNVNLYIGTHKMEAPLVAPPTSQI